MSDESNGARFGVWALHRGYFDVPHFQPLLVEQRTFALQVAPRVLEREQKILEIAR